MNSSGAVSNLRPGVPGGFAADPQPGFGAPIGPGTLTSTPPIQPRDARPADTTDSTSAATPSLPGGSTAPTPLLGGSSWGSPAPAPSPRN